MPLVSLFSSLADVKQFDTPSGRAAYFPFSDFFTARVAAFASRPTALPASRNPCPIARKLSFRFPLPPFDDLAFPFLGPARAASLAANSDKATSRIANDFFIMMIVTKQRKQYQFFKKRWRPV